MLKNYVVGFNGTWGAICALKKYAVHVEVLCTVLPILGIKAEEKDIGIIRQIEGIGSVEETHEGEFIALKTKEDSSRPEVTR